MLESGDDRRRRAEEERAVGCEERVGDCLGSAETTKRVVKAGSRMGWMLEDEGWDGK